MPKIKSHKGTAKRIRKSASGKLIHDRAFRGHFLHGKSASRKRNTAHSKTISSGDNGNVKRALGV